MGKRRAWCYTKLEQRTLAVTEPSGRPLQSMQNRRSCHNAIVKDALTKIFGIHYMNTTSGIILIHLHKILKYVTQFSSYIYSEIIEFLESSGISVRTTIQDAQNHQTEG